MPTEILSPEQIAEIKARQLSYMNHVCLSDDDTALEFHSTSVCADASALVECDIPALLASHAALAERVAALEAALLIRDGLRDNAVEVEKKLARVLGVPEGSRLDDEWDEIIEAREAGSVPREVALRACEQAWKGGYGGSITSVDFAHDCLARAEAEAKEAKP